MAEDGQPVEIPDSKTHTDHDFMSAIDAQMEALDHEAVESEPQPELAKPKDDGIAPEEAAAREDVGQKITVKTSPTRQQVEDKPTETSDVEKDKEENDKSEETLSHKGKKLKPITLKSTKSAEADTQQEPDDSQTQSRPDSDKSAKQEEQRVEVKTNQTNQEQSKPEKQNTVAEQSQEDNPTPEKHPEPKSPVEQTADAAANKNKKPKKPQPLKTFDTTKYHLPIKPTRHHRKYAVHPMTATLLIGGLVLLIGVAAIDMEIFDIGIELPFDLL